MSRVLSLLFDRKELRKRDSWHEEQTKRKFQKTPMITVVNGNVYANGVLIGNSVTTSIIGGSGGGNSGSSYYNNYYSPIGSAVTVKGLT